METEKRNVLAVTKCDLVPGLDTKSVRRRLPSGLPIVFISAATGAGLDKLKNEIWKQLNSPASSVGK